MQATAEIAGFEEGPVPSVRVLGVWVDSKLRWGPHIKKAALNALRRADPVLLNVDAALKVAEEVVLPVSSTAFTASRLTHTRADLAASTLDDFKARGFTIVPWDGKCVIAVHTLLSAE